MLEIICIACATPSVPRTCCFEASEISWTSSADWRTTLEMASSARPAWSAFHFLRALLHDDHRLVRFGLNRLDEGGNVFRRATAMFGQLADFVGDDRESASGLSCAGGFDGGVQGEQIGLLGNVVNHVDDFRNFQRAVAE